MGDLTPIRGIGWLILFSLFFAVAILAMSLRRDVPGHRVGGLLVIPLVSGVLLLGGIGLSQSEELSDILPFLRRPVTAILAVGAAFLAVAVADFLFTRLATLPERLWNWRSSATRANVGLAVFVGGAALVVLVALLRVEGREGIEPTDSSATALGSAWGLEVEGVTDLPGQPLGVALRGKDDGYISVGGDRVMHFELGNDGQPLDFTPVAEGLTYARGLAVAGDVLVVSDLGPLPECPEPFPYCKANSVEEERRILESSNGRLVAYDIEPDGTLTGERVIADGLPVVSHEHGVNGVVAGPDGHVYAAIGNVDWLLPLGDARQPDGYFYAPEERFVAIEHPRRDLLGTVIRVPVNGDRLEVYARGLRNVFGLALDEEGGLWGVDNDGSAASGWYRAEEILQIQSGRNYGFPQDGTFGPQSVRDDWPVWLAEGVGSAAVSWTGDVGLGAGLLIGLCGHIDGLRLAEYQGEWVVEGGGDYGRLLEVPGCVTAITPVGDGRVLAAVFDTEALYLLRATSDE